MEEIKLAIRAINNSYLLENYEDSHLSCTAYIHRTPDEANNNRYHVLVPAVSISSSSNLGKSTVKLWDKKGVLIKDVQEKHFKRTN